MLPSLAGMPGGISAAFCLSVLFSDKGMALRLAVVQK